MIDDNRATHRSILPWVFPAMLAVAALEILLSGRDLTQAFLALEKEAEGLLNTARPPLLVWVQRVVSVLLVAGSLQRIGSHLLQNRPLPAPALTGAFLLFWLTTVAMPAVFGAHPQLSHEYAYSLLIGTACTMALPDDRDRILALSRNGLFVYMLAGLVLLPWNPAMVLDSSYAQGLLPGVPRFGGLASHPVMMGLLTQTALLLLWARPFQRRWLTVCAWLLGLTVLFFAQSKTAWLAFLISACCMLFVRRGRDSMDRLGNPRDNSFGVLLCIGLMLLVVAGLVAVLVLDLQDAVLDFLGSSQGAQLVSLTGRDRIWAVAFQEWHNHPVFGYGPTIWDADYRQAIGMPNATHGHNQFIDTLARCGLVGVFGLVVYALVLLVMAFRSARATHGLSLAMFTTLALLSVSEVPLLLSGYGTELFTHLLLVVVLAGAAAARARRTVVDVQPLDPVSLRTAS